MYDRDVASEIGACEVRRRKGDLILGQLNGCHRPTDRASGAREPQCRIAVRRTNLEHPPRQRRSDQHRKELAGVAGDVEHASRTLGRRSIIHFPELLDLDQHAV